MFLTAVARPRFNADGQCIFDGKIGIWPFTEQVAAKRGSKNRPKGTIETKCIESVTQVEVRKMLCEKLFPAIRKKWPKESKNQKIFIQQDNAKPHLSVSDGGLTAEAHKYGWNMEMKAQPPNSPDLNVLDLGFFHSIQSIQHRTSQNNIDELINVVINAFNDENPNTLDNVFLSLQCAMEDTLKVNTNKYKVNFQTAFRIF